MGRKSKLTDNQWKEIVNRHLQGEKIRPLSREYGISEAAIRQQINTQCFEIKDVAKQIVKTEERFQALPVTTQISVVNYASQLRAISDNMAGAAVSGSLTASRLSAIAASQVDKIDPHESFERNGEALKSVMAITQTANNAAVIGLNLLKANKEVVETDNIKTMTREQLLQKVKELLGKSNLN